MSIATTFKEMDTKKKIKLGIFIIILIIVIWELLGMLGGSSSTTVQPMQTIQPSAPVAPPATTTLKEKQYVPVKVTSMEAIQKNQVEYVKQLNELQLLQVQQKIVATQQSIADSKLALVKSEQAMKSLTNPASVQPQPSVNDYAQKLTIPGSNFLPPSVQAAQAGNYKLLYVANESGTWQAIIGDSGKLYNVSLNTTLPDGSIVVDISSTSVVLNNNGDKKVISLTPVM